MFRHIDIMGGQLKIPNLSPIPSVSLFKGDWFLGRISIEWHVGINAGKWRLCPAHREQRDGDVRVYDIVPLVLASVFFLRCVWLPASEMYFICFTSCVPLGPTDHRFPDDLLFSYQAEKNWLWFLLLLTCPWMVGDPFASPLHHPFKPARALVMQLQDERPAFPAVGSHPSTSVSELPSWPLSA